jgi:hypothetical protein
MGTTLWSCTSSAPERGAVARLALVNPPADVACVKVVVAGGRTVSRAFDLFAGAAIEKRSRRYQYFLPRTPGSTSNSPFPSDTM